MMKRNSFSHVFLVVLTFVWCAPVFATDYYVDATNGNDSLDGTSAADAWKTLSEVEAHSSFLPGDRILLKRGEQWREGLNFTASGSYDDSITIGAYGDVIDPRPLLLGSAPISAGNPNTWTAWNSWSYLHTLGPQVSGDPRSEWATTVPQVFKIVDGVYEDVPVGAYVEGNHTDASLLNEGEFLAPRNSTTGWKRKLIYRPKNGEDPWDFAWEVAKYSSPYVFSGDYLRVENLHFRFSSPGQNSKPMVYITGNHVGIFDSVAEYSHENGIECNLAAHCIVSGVTAQYNRSTGIYLRGDGSEPVPPFLGGLVENSISRYNGNVQYHDHELADRGGIGVDGVGGVIVRGNTVIGNGTILSPDDPGDFAINFHLAPYGTAEYNFIKNSVLGALYGAPNSHHLNFHHNIISDWNLVDDSIITSKKSAISVFGQGDDENSGYHTVKHNIIVSKRTGANLQLIGLNVAASLWSDKNKNTQVIENLVYFNSPVFNAGIYVNKVASNQPGLVLDRNWVTVNPEKSYSIFGDLYDSTQDVKDDGVFEQNGIFAAGEGAEEVHALLHEAYNSIP